MRRFTTVLCLVVLPLAAGTMTRTVRFTESDLSVTAVAGFDDVQLRGCMATGVPGAPCLPELMQSVVVPAGAKVTGVEVVAEEWVDVPGVFNVGPAQPDYILPRPGHTEEPELVGPDPAMYGSADPYPGVVLRSLSSGTMSGYRIANVVLYPVRWTPATGRLQLATKLGYRLSYTVSEQAAVATERQREVFGRTVRTLVVNPGDVDRYAPKVRRSTASFLPPGDYEYVIITESPMDTVFERLAEWKTLKGVPGTVVLISWIESNYTGRDLAEKIRNFIKDAHDTWGTIYALLGGSGDYRTGSENIFPTRMANYIGDEPCDLYYGGLDGDWDADGDNRFGEIADSADMYSDVYVGRASVYTVAMAQNFVAKTLKYEQDPPSGFIKRMLLPTAILWSSYEERPMVESIARQTGPDWQDGRLYERTGTLSQSAVNDSLDDGWGMSHWDGHGSPTGIYMGSNPFFTSTDALNLTNGDKTGTAAAIACDCAAWDEVSGGGDCLAENMVNATGGGFIGSVMNTRYGYGAIGPGGGYVPGPSERLDTTMYAGILLYDMPSTGQALGYSKATWAPYADSLYQYAKQRWCIYDLTLIGDPETPLWTDEPTLPQVSHNGVVNIGNNMPYTVTVSSGYAPVESALVVLRKGTEVNERGRTDGSGEVTLYVSALTPGPMLLTVNAHDHYIVQDTVIVIASDRYVCYFSSDVDDPAPEGNGDGVINPGEEVEVMIWVKNWGEQNAQGVTGRLFSNTPGVTVTDTLVSFGDVASGDSVCGATGFGLLLDPGLPDEYWVSCSLVCRDNLDSCWSSKFKLQAFAAAPYFVDVEIDDAIGIWPNGRIDPGEDVELVVEVGNQGMGNSFEVRGVLRALDSLCMVTDTHALFGTVLSGSTRVCTDRFGIRANAHLPPESRLHYELEILWDHGNDTTVTFDLLSGGMVATDPIPDGPRIPPLYFAYDDADWFYSEAPDYDWVELRGVGTELVLDDQETQALALPDAFGPLVFYNESFDTISVCSNGWIAPGVTTDRSWQNRELPTARNRALIAPLWDDLLPPYGGGVLYHHDAAHHRFVIEWDSVHYSWAREDWDEFQVVFYDTTQAAEDGNTVFTFQYKTANNYVSATVGMQPYWTSPDTIGIGCLYNETYHRGASVIIPGAAIKFTTDPPELLGVAEEVTPASLLRGRKMVVAPNPFNRTALVHWNLERDADVSLQVFDASGRAVRTLATGRRAAGTYTTTWDGQDDAGRELARGIYFVRLKTPSEMVKTKTILAR